jgi:hypothetical protein
VERTIYNPATAVDPLNAAVYPIGMTPSPKEIAVGQKAYQRVRSYSRASRGTMIYLPIWFGWSAVRAFSKGQYEGVIVALVIGAVVITGSLYERRRNRRDLTLLQSLKATYGTEGCTEIRKEPSTLYYRFFQKPRPLFWRTEWRSQRDPLAA